MPQDEAEGSRNAFQGHSALGSFVIESLTQFHRAHAFHYFLSLPFIM